MIPYLTFETVKRSSAVGHAGTELEALWGLIAEDMSDQSVTRIRRLEAQLGFDPEECAEAIVAHALALQARMGDATMSELAPVFGKQEGGVRLDKMEELTSIPGILGKPVVEPARIAVGGDMPPWCRAVMAAKQLRAHMGNAEIHSTIVRFRTCLASLKASSKRGLLPRSCMRR